MYFKKYKGVKSKKLYVYLSMNDGSGRSKQIAADEGDSFTLPDKPPFTVIPGAEFKGWSMSACGTLLAAGSTISVQSNLTLFARYEITITFDPGLGTGTPITEVIDQTMSYELPKTTTFVAPTGKTFDGWAYNKEDIFGIETEFIKILRPMTLFCHWSSGYEGWTQLLTVDKPTVVTNLNDIYKTNNSSYLYQYNGDNYVYNNVMLTALKCPAKMEPVTNLPKTAPSGVIYKRTQDDVVTYWHFQWDVVKGVGGAPTRDDKTVWESVNILSVDDPKIASNTYEVYYRSSDQRNYYYDYKTEAWNVQNPEAPQLKEYQEVKVEDLSLVEKPEYLPDKFYKVTQNFRGNDYYGWLRLVDEEYHHPERPKIDPTIYWILDNDKHLWVAAHPIQLDTYMEIGNFPSDWTNQSGTWGLGPWSDIKTKVKDVTFLEDIAPRTLEHWFDAFPILESINGWEHLKVNYVLSLDAFFCACSSGGKFKQSKIDLSTWETECLINAPNFFGSWDGPNLEEIDISSMDTSKVKSFWCVFAEHSHLKHIYVGDKWSLESITDLNNQHPFEHCSSLHNWNGTNQLSKAIIDDGKNGGYLERKCIVYLNPNEKGKGDIQKRFVVKEGTFTLPKEGFFEPIHPLNVFLGWSTTTSEENIIKTDTIKITADTTLYAIWTSEI